MIKNGLPTVIFLAVFYLLLFTPRAFAYIDPGTGSMILQALLAGLVAILAFWKQLCAKIAVFRAKSDSGKTAQGTENIDD